MIARGLQPGQIAEGRGEYGGEPYWICGGPANARELLDASDVVEQLMERACEAAGHDVAEPIDILPDHDLLQDLLDFWCARHVVVNAWQADREPERIDP